MKEMDTQCKALETPEYEDIQTRFIASILDQKDAKELQYLDEQEDEYYMSKKSTSSKKDLFTNVNADGEEDEYEEELETS